MIISWSYTFLKLSLILKVKSPGLPQLVLVLHRDAAHKRYGSHPSAETHTLNISARNNAKSILQLAKNSFINRKCQNLSNSNSTRDFWHLANNNSNNFTSSFFLLYFNQMALQLSFLSLKLNSSLKLLLGTLLWMILIIFLLLFHPLTNSSLKLEFSIMTFFHALSGLDSQKTYGPDGVPPVVLRKMCFRALLIPILLAGSLLTFNLSLKWVTVPILQTTAQ